MFAKQAQIAVAALAFAVAGSAFAADKTERNVFDTDTAIVLPAAKSESGLTRQQVRAEFLAARAAGDLSVFDYETVAYRPTAERAQQTRLAQATK